MCHDSQLHCNAHSNNMVLVPEPEPSIAAAEHNFLAFLDLDMAFDRQSFVDTSKGTLGASLEKHQKLLHLEHVNFAEVLAGADSTSGVPGNAESRLHAQPESVRLLHTAVL